MKKWIPAVSAVLLAMTALPACAKDKTAERLASPTGVITEIMGTPDKGIPQSILSGAKCVVVVPAYKKGAFGIGLQYGRGVATCRTASGKWSAPAFVKLEGGSFGFQIGGQSTDLVLVAMNDGGLQHMLHNKFKIGGDAAASAGPVGRNAQAGTDWKLNAEFLTYSRSKGLFAGINLDGTVLSSNKDDMEDEYGANVSYESVLQGSVPAQPDAVPFVHTVARAFRTSKAAQ